MAISFSIKGNYVCLSGLPRSVRGRFIAFYFYNRRRFLQPMLENRTTYRLPYGISKENILKIEISGKELEQK